MNNLGHSLLYSINSHGYAFQYSLLKYAKDLFFNAASPWTFEASEFPVSVQGKSLHIDFILRHKHQHFYLVAECKRSNPAIANWCFVKTPYVGNNISTGERIVREVVYGNSKIPKDARVRLEWVERSSDVYRLCFELKTGERGDTSNGKGRFNESITQVLRGVNGLINFAGDALRKENERIFDKDAMGRLTASFMPVIFTTAKLWTSDLDISRAEIESGKLNAEEVPVTEKRWLFFHYGQSPDLKHTVGSFPTPRDISESLYFAYTRTVAIVTAAGLSDFLTSDIWRYPEDWQEG